METFLGPKKKIIFECKFCDYKSSKKSQYDRHLLTLKHKRTQTATVLGPKKKYVCECGKEYSYRGSLHKHRNKCEYSEVPNNLIMKLIEENHDIKDCLLKENKELKEQIQQQNKHISELIPKIGNQYKQEFNINVFLNEKCKNAISIDKFIEDIEVTLKNLLITKERGNAIGISKIIVENMNKLSLYERPLHCMDKKNEILYIKHEDWVKDDNNKFKELLKHVGLKQIKNLNLWLSENPDYMNDPKKQEELADIISECGKNEETKIKKLLCSELYFKKN